MSILFESEQGIFINEDEIRVKADKMLINNYSILRLEYMKSIALNLSTYITLGFPFLTWLIRNLESKQLMSVIKES